MITSTYDAVDTGIARAIQIGMTTTRTIALCVAESRDCSEGALIRIDDGDQQTLHDVERILRRRGLALCDVPDEDGEACLWQVEESSDEEDDEFEACSEEE